MLNKEEKEILRKLHAGKTEEVTEYMNKKYPRVELSGEEPGFKWSLNFPETLLVLGHKELTERFITSTLYALMVSLSDSEVLGVWDEILSGFRSYVSDKSDTETRAILSEDN
jgi:hypothetical protein